MTFASTDSGSALDQRSPGVAVRITPLALLGGRHATRVLERLGEGFEDAPSLEDCKALEKGGRQRPENPE